MILDLPDTSTTAVNKKLDELRERVGAVTLGRVLTLVIVPDTDAVVEESIEAANFASHEHPSRVIVVMTGDRDAPEARLDAQLRAGGDSGAGEVVVLRLSGPLADHAGSVVVPFLLPDIPVVAWWPDIAPRCPLKIRWASWRSAASPMPPTGWTRCRRSRADCPATPPATPTWPGAASRIGVHCWPRRSISRHTSRSPPRWFRDSKPSRRSMSWRVGWPAGSTGRCTARWATSRSSWFAPPRR